MAAVNEQEAEANEASDVVAYPCERPRLWDNAPGSRRALAEALFERVEVLGLRRMSIEPTPPAIAVGLVLASSRASAGYGRGERSQASGTDLFVPVKWQLPVRVG